MTLVKGAPDVYSFFQVKTRYQLHVLNYDGINLLMFLCIFVDGKPQNAYFGLSHPIALVKGKFSVSVIMKYLLV